MENKFLKRILMIMIVIIFTIALLPTFLIMSDDYNRASIGETFIAIEVLAVPEVVTISETPIEVINVFVEGIELTLTTEYTVSGSNITVLANNSETDDVIVVYYIYDLETTASQDLLVDLIPTLTIIIAISGIIYFGFKFQKY